jgi:hypothetical protein
MRDLLRTIRSAQTASYLGQVIKEVVPLQNDVRTVQPL